jgi:hypothetical protein
MDFLFDPIPIEFMAIDSSSRLLTILLNANRFEEFRNSIGEVTQEALMSALEWTAKRGMLEDMKLVLNHLPMLNKWTIVPHLSDSHPTSIPILLDKLEPLTAVDLTYLMTDFTVQPENLRQLLRHSIYRPILFQLKAPAPIKPIAGFGFSSVLQRKNDRYALYESIIQEEKLRVIKCMWRVLFWSVVLRTRIMEFQARYWGPEGKGYLKSKASFESLQSK